MFFALAGLASIVQIVCLILVLIKIFQDGKVGLGVLGIFCGIFTFIYGWINVDRYRLRTVMIVWTAALVVSLGAGALVPHTTVVYPNNGGAGVH